jgi:Ca2+-transporting ATPase
LGGIAERIRSEPDLQTPLQQRVAQLGRVLAVAVLVVCGVAFGLGVLLGESPQEMFLVAVALAVAVIPEGMPIVFTITMAIGVRRMARRNAIVRRLPAVETLGSTTVIGSDKTGTLTENRMTVRKAWAGGRTFTLTDDVRWREEGLGAEAPPGSLEGPLYLALLAGVLTNEAELAPTPGGWKGSGDPTEVALLRAAVARGIDPAAARADHPVYQELPFEPERQYSASIRTYDGRYALFVKGAPERVLDRCSQMATAEGSSSLHREVVQSAVADMASEGLRVLAMAYRPLDPVSSELVEEPSHLTFLGLQGMQDPPRLGVREAVAACQRAGIRVVMITGDHAETARAIGRDLVIAGPDAPVLTGMDLEVLDDAALREQVQEVAIYARVPPDQKLRIVHALRDRGEVVAVTGDGVNDAPALKAADIGVAMGKSGTDVAREAADIVLADDNFVSIRTAVEQGRITFDNLRNATFFLLSTNAAEVLTLLLALALGWPLPFIAAQILWLNLVTEGVQDEALAFEPGEPGVLERPPRPRREGIMPRLLWERAVLAALVIASGTLLVFQWELQAGSTLQGAQTAALTTIVLFQAFQVNNARSEYRSIFRLNPLSNPFLFVATAAALAVHVGAMHFPLTQILLRLEPLSWETWGRMLLVAVAVVPAMEIHKLLRRDSWSLASRAAPPPG